MSWLGLFMLVVAGCFAVSPDDAAAQGVCADDGGAFPKACTKEIRIYNNTPRKIWVVLQASIQLTDAISCPVDTKGGGDVWLQVALGNTNNCFAVKSDYYAFINPGAGIPTGDFVSIYVPWWSKRANANPDLYIDWWRGARVIIFDDPTALKEIRDKVSVNPVVAFANGSPIPRCNKDMDGSGCNQLKIYEVKPGNGIDPHLPFQLNEFTFGGLCKVRSDGTFEPKCQKDNPSGFIDFNQNYNVSNVDQVYLPLAMEPVRKPANVGYMGTTLTVQKFRNQLKAFANSNNPQNLRWPIYNNPTVNGKKMYPNAAVRIPSAQTVFSFYMNPTNFPDGKTPTIIPKAPPVLVKNMIDQWRDCTSATPSSCAKLQSDYYKAINDVFLDNYKSYITTCPDDKVPAYLKKVKGSPPTPKMMTFLTFIYGWVPFNVNCGNKELPVVDDRPPDSRSVVDYFQVQYNYQDLPQKKPQWFNPYTQLIHDDISAGGLDASAYAFSIDDHASFLSNSGGSLPGGLIFAVGGPKGLANGKPHAPPVPPLYKWYDFSIGLGKPDQNGPFWQKYGICSNTADTLFPSEIRDGFVIGIDPALTKITPQKPCPITLVDTANRKYQIVILKAKPPGESLPQSPIWPKFQPGAGRNFDPAVVSCPDKNGFVAPELWCNHANEVSQPSVNPNQEGFYTIGTPPPLDNQPPQSAGAASPAQAALAAAGFDPAPLD